MGFSNLIFTPSVFLSVPEHENEVGKAHLFARADKGSLSERNPHYLRAQIIWFLSDKPGFSEKKTTLSADNVGFFQKNHTLSEKNPYYLIR